MTFRYLHKLSFTGLMTTSYLLLSGCVSQSAMGLHETVTANHDSRLAYDTAECLSVIATTSDARGDGLNPESIRVLNWNMQKAGHPDAIYELGLMGGNHDLVLIQEAPLRTSMTDALNNTDYWTFAPGYQSRTDMTGVMTLSKVESTSRCQFSSIEPWLGTPKATGIATYRLANADVNLLVINIHGINFTVGTAQLERQLQQLDELISIHQGPVILAGDFNTWKKKRSELLGSFVQQLDMEAVEFPNDQRVTAFGNTLDHMFVRNLSPVFADTLAVDTSDHNPMSVELRFQQ